MKRGEIYRVHKPGGDAKQHRLFIIVSRQVLIDSKFSTVVCAPVFFHGQALSTQVALGPEEVRRIWWRSAGEGWKHPSWIMCDNLVSLRKTELSHFVAQLPAVKIAELDRSLRIALSI